jgi:hypothetical protein
VFPPFAEYRSAARHGPEVPIIKLRAVDEETH